MTTFLLDVNVLIALIDPAHVQHDAAHHWFAETGSASWATCPLTENGLLRIVGHPRYPNTVGTPATVAVVLRALRALPGHHFWPDDISLLSPELILTDRLLSHTQITDSYLLALARHHSGKLASFDRKLITDAVVDGQSALAIL